MDPVPEEKKNQRHPKDPRFLLAYKIPDLEKVLPWTRKTIHELIDLQLFPKGWALTPNGHEVWTKKLLDAYLDMIGAEAMAELPRIVERVRETVRQKVA